MTDPGKALSSPAPSAPSADAPSSDAPSSDALAAHGSDALVAAHTTAGAHTKLGTPGATAAVPGVAHPRVIRSFVRRAGRTTVGQSKAYDALGPRFLLPYRPGPLNFSTAFGREAPVILEIGFGMGEADLQDYRRLASESGTEV